jgi:histidine phosphotransfer protein HptB
MNTLSWNKEFALEQAADDAELLRELLEIFKGSFYSDLTLIKEGIQKGNMKQVYSASHSIKGAAASLGIEGIRGIALDIEVDSRNGSLAVAKEKIHNLEDMYLQLQKL